MADVNYEVVRKIAVLSAGSKISKELNLIKWGRMEPSIDIRKWDEGKPGKGITLTFDEARKLYEALGDELKNTKAKVD